MRSAWTIRFSDEFEAWFDKLETVAKNAGFRALALLGEEGPSLGRPQVDSIKGSRHPNMKELRAQAGGRAIRMFFAFDPNREAIMLVGGDKTGDKRFYSRMIALADDLYDRHLATL